MRALRRFASAALLPGLLFAAAHCTSSGTPPAGGQAGTPATGAVAGVGAGQSAGNGPAAGSSAGGATSGSVNVEMGGQGQGGESGSESTIKTVQPDPSTLIVEWNDKAGARYQVELNLGETGALFRKVSQAPDGAAPFATIASEVDAKFRITAGTRERGLSWPYIFADRVDLNLPAPSTSVSELKVSQAQVETDGPRHTRVVLSTLTAGPFSGNLVLNFYDGSPFVHAQAALQNDTPWVAYIYDGLVYGDFASVGYFDTADAFQSAASSSLPADPGNGAALKTRYRAVAGKAAGGSLAVFPGPHTGVYPTDRSDNFGFSQAGTRFIGTRMDFDQDTWRVWVDAPQGQVQNMDAFLLLSAGEPQAALERVKEYTRGDSFKAVPGHYTMAEHFHAALAVDYQQDSAGKAADAFKAAMVAAGVNLVHLMEFHGDGHPDATGAVRLDEMQAMFQVATSKFEPNEFMFVPGEEYNAFFGGHWVYMFPKPVYFTRAADAGTPYKETLPNYGTVYHVRDSASMYQLLKDEGGLAWVAHPRTKSSERFPDSFVNEPFFRDPLFLAGDWKPLPADLSRDRLGERSFGLFDDIAQWGFKKAMLGTTDTFKLDPTHNIYSCLNVNYLKLDAFPTSSDWSNVVSALKNGDFFTTTGEVLIHSFEASPTQVKAALEWTLPLSFADIVWGNAEGVHHERVSLAEGVEHDMGTFAWDVDLSQASWVRLEVWDIARDGAFTQQQWLKGAPTPPASVVPRIQSISLIDPDTDLPVPGLRALEDGQTLSRARLPPNLTLMVNTNPYLVTQVQLELDGAAPIAEVSYPYAFGTTATGGADLNGTTYDYGPIPLENGQHTLKATPTLAGTTGPATTITFTIGD